MPQLALAALAAADLAAEEEAVLWWQEPTLWVGAAFLVVVALLYRTGAFKTLASALDKRGQKIADELNLARSLREEAQALLAKSQKRQREAEIEAKVIVEEARREAAIIAEEMRAAIVERTERRLKAAEDRIARSEAQAIAEVRGEAADLAIEAAREIIRSRIDHGAHVALVEKSISELRAAAQ